nr:MAG TPA: restriction alleviation protein [Caudoviricetes sp.]
MSCIIYVVILSGIILQNLIKYKPCPFWLFRFI